jgi:hypothetical protein
VAGKAVTLKNPDGPQKVLKEGSEIFKAHVPLPVSAFSIK